MKTFANLTRVQRIEKIKSMRRTDLAVILENLAEEQNISAILRTVEGFGIDKVFIVHIEGKKPKISKNVSSGAVKWLDISFFTDINSCIKQVKKDGFKVYATMVDPEAHNLWSTEFTDKVAIMVGNEAQGVSEEGAKLADQKVYLQMFGMTESFNVSVAAALFLYEAVRQKEIKLG